MNRRLPSVLVIMVLTLGAEGLWAAPEATYRVSATITVGNGPNSVAANPATNRV